MELAAPGFGGVGAFGRESTPLSCKRGVVSSPEQAHSLNRWARTPAQGNPSILFFISFIPQPAPLFFFEGAEPWRAMLEYIRQLWIWLGYD